VKLTLTGNPVSVNQLYSGRRFLTERGKRTKEDYFWQAKAQYNGAQLSGDLKVELVVYFRSKNTSDIDNVCKATLDSLTGCIWIDDRQIVELHVYKRQDKSYPRIEIDITPA
jgi:Holliday junction resolvase RusA-like endonuclease